MPARLKVLGKAARYALPALMLAAVLGILSLQQSSQAAWSQGVHWHPARQRAELASPLRALLPALPNWSANLRANADSTTSGQHEPGLAVSPVNPDVVVVASKDWRINNVKQVWIQASRDGGQTWPTQLHMPNLPNSQTEFDPVVIARDDGRIYVSCITTGNNGVFITWTDDDGVTWRPSVPIVDHWPEILDREWFAIDNNPASPYYHRIYMAFGPSYTGIVSVYSTDGGLTWTAPQTVSPSGPADYGYAYPVVTPNGDVFLFYLYGIYERRPFPSTIEVVKSTDGGVSWSAPVSVADIYQPHSPPRPSDLWRFYSLVNPAADPSDNNRLYVATTDDFNHDTNGLEVVYSATTDHGATWSPLARLSHDPTGVVRDHITPMLNVSADGRLDALWLDRRLDPNNVLFQAWYTSSTDGGVTWEADSQVSDVPGLGFSLGVGLPPGSGNAAGDYWGLGASGDYIYAAWNDTRNGNQDIYTSRAWRPAASPTPTFTATASATNTPPPPTSTPTGTGTGTPTAALALVGHVTWQGRPAQPSSLQQLPITLTLRLGTTELNYPVQTTDARGFFTVAVGSLSGAYNWRVKGPKYLANAGQVTLTGAPITPAEMGLMEAGDCDNDNLVAAIDFIILRNTFGKTTGYPGYDARADFDGDNTVTTVDFILQRLNFGTGERLR